MMHRLLPALCIGCLLLSACGGNTQASWQGSEGMMQARESASESMSSSGAPIVAKAVALVVPKAQAAQGGSHARPFRVPILMFHYIRPMPGPKDKLGQGLTVTPVHFDHDLTILQQKGYQTISFADLAETGAALPSKPIIISFDDGYQDAYDNAFPALLAHHMTGTFFIISGFVGKPNFSTWDELKKMSGSGMEIGAHTVDHLNLASLSFVKQQYEIMQSIETIDAQLDVHVLALAYPAGRYNADSMKICRSAGMKFAVTTHPGVATNVYNPMELPRVRIGDTTNFEKMF